MLSARDAAVPLEIRLITVAINLFGRDGVGAVGTRAIAEAANAQMSAITYHFGGKEGLYLACARHIAETMKERIAPLLVLPLEKVPRGAAQARGAIIEIVGGLAGIMMLEEVAPLARFVVREQMDPGPAFAVLYDGAMRAVIERIGDLVKSVAKDKFGTEELRVRTIALLGQAFAFRFARAGLMRATGWRDAGDREVEIVQTIVKAHTRAILKDLASGSRP